MLFQNESYEWKIWNIRKDVIAQHDDEQYYQKSS